MSFRDLNAICKSAAAISICTVLLFAAVQKEIPQPSRADDRIYVGLIEDDRTELAHLGPKDFNPVKNRVITPAFVKDRSAWKALARLNEKITWTVAFDGKNLGEMESEPVTSTQVPSEKIPGPSDVHSILTPADKVPTVGKPEGKFNGNFETVVRRPLVVVSRPNFTDPDQWKRAKVPDQVIAQVRSSFRKEFGHLRQCDTSGEPLKTDWSIPDSEIVVAKGYASNKHEFIVETKVLHNKCLFSAHGDDFQSLGGNQVFYAGPDGQAVFLGLQWELVDAGDYDADGKSEVIFYIAEGKDVDVVTEGYVLFYDGFRRSVRFTWTNH